MATILDLFKNQNKELYGLSGKVIIESRGLINPPRGAALLASSPNALGDLIGNQIGGALKGSANRPSDTIFKSNAAIKRPITLGKTEAGIKDAIVNGETYFVKQSPAPASIIAQLAQGGSSPAGLAGAAAASAINKFGSKNALKDLVKGLKEKEVPDSYGTQFMKQSNNKIIYEPDGITFSTHYRNAEGGLSKRGKTLTKNFDSTTVSILNVLAKNNSISNDDVKKFIDDNAKIQTPYVLIQRYNKKDDNILLPGTITGINEESTPEWSTFKYIGSPFNNYRYLGVEKTLQFELKMYYLDDNTKLSMKKSLDKLRGLVYPDEDISVVTYPNNGGYSPMNFNGNLIYLTINGLYDSLFGFIDTLTISIDDAHPWSTSTSDYFDGSKTKPYPSVITVSIGMKIINNPEVKDNKYVFTHTETPAGYINKNNYLGDDEPINANKKTAIAPPTLNKLVLQTMMQKSLDNIKSSIKK
jgi:hypothetical protein